MFAHMSIDILFRAAPHQSEVRVANNAINNAAET
jgi:hypothetical protein